MGDLILFWHRRDLRLGDHLGLTAARERSKKVVGFFCFDRHLFTPDNIAPSRVAYLIGCLQVLAQSYQEIGSQLLFVEGEPAVVIPRLVQALKPIAVYWCLDVEPYAQERDRHLQTILEALGVTVSTHWDQLLHAPETIKTGSQQPYTVYTPFWKNWSQKPKEKPAPPLRDLEGLGERELETVEEITIPLPRAQDLGFIWEQGLILEPGEKAAKERLEYFGDRALEEYQEQRNFPGVDGTSQLSLALNLGAIGIRTLWERAVLSLVNVRSEEAIKSIQTWQQELAWREFYQHALYFFPQLAEGPYRPQFRDFPWENNEEYFGAWCQGKTGYPIVDAAMRQLNETGWMHNRCRMIVANFLTKDLRIDWRWGEKYFMQCLIDGDLAANNGGWQWSASTGMDPRPLRIFNPASQAQKFDPEGEYIRQWLPELRSIDTEYLVTGKIPKSELECTNYPAPIVDHQERQREFKEYYRQCQF